VVSARCDVLYFSVMTDTTVKLVAGILCLVLVAIIILRRKNKKKTDEDEF
jgi:LPXTG-motif cell wall-anchored protein